jgi:hypothetical protein
LWSAEALLRHSTYARSRLGPADDPSDRRWLRTWPLTFRSLMFIGVVAVYLPVQIAFSSELDFLLSPEFPGAPLWYYIHFAGVFCFLAGLFTSVITLIFQWKWLKKLIPTNRMQNLLRAPLLLGAVLLAGVIFFSGGMPKTSNLSYCQGTWECDLVDRPGSSVDLWNLSCISYHRYSAFWPPSYTALCGSPFCRGIFGCHPLCYCEDNRCVVNYHELLR